MAKSKSKKATTKKKSTTQKKVIDIEKLFKDSSYKKLSDKTLSISLGIIDNCKLATTIISKELKSINSEITDLDKQKKNGVLKDTDEKTGEQNFKDLKFELIEKLSKLIVLQRHVSLMFKGTQPEANKELFETMQGDLSLIREVLEINELDAVE